MIVRRGFVLPPPPIRSRLVLDTGVPWLVLRLVLAAKTMSACQSGACEAEGLAEIVRLSPPGTLALIGIVVLLSAVQVGRMSETHLLRNLGVSRLAQTVFSAAVATFLELSVLAVTSLFPGGVG